VRELIASRLTEIRELCRTTGVRRLDVFGSAAGGPFHPATSDVDVLVEFSDDRDLDRFGAYFTLKEGLEDLLGRPVDVVVASAVRNPYFLEQVMQTRELLYAA
jgi:uncharacterized protein